MKQKIWRILTSKPKITVAVTLTALAGALFYHWLSFHIFTYGDWSYRPLQDLKESIWPSSWVGDTAFGSFNEFLWRMPLDVLFGLFAWVGAGINIADKFLIFWPLIVTAVTAPYFFLKELTGRRIAALAGTVFYATNTYFLTINTQGHQLLVLAFNILTLAFMVLMRAVKTNRSTLFVGAALLMFVSGFVDFRVFYISFFLFSAYLVCFWPKGLTAGARKRFRKNLALFYAIAIGMQFYWLIAFGMNLGSDNSEVLARSLFGNNFWDLASAVTVHHPFWNGVSTTWFLPNAAPYYFWIIPMLAFGALLVRPRTRVAVFFALAAVVGIVLGKQVSDPFGQIYTFLFNHFPGFSAFREATKFYFLVVLGYTVLLGILAVRLFDARTRSSSKRIKTYVLAGVFAALCLVNAWPYISGSMHRLLATRTMPSDYAKLEADLSSPKNNDYYRTMWVPAYSRWSYYSQEHPRVSATFMLSDKVDNPHSAADVPTQKDIINLVKSNNFEHYLATTSVKYVVVPLRESDNQSFDNQNDFYAFYGDSRQPYIDALDNIPYLQKVPGYKDLAVYEYKNYKPYITASSNLYQVQNSTAFAQLYPFFSQTLGKNAIYNYPGSSQAPAQSVTDVFANFKSNDYQQNNLTLKPATGANLYFNTNKQYYSYTTSDGVLTLYKRVNNLQQTSGTATTGIMPGTPEQVASVPIEAGKNYYLRSNDKIVPIDPTQTSRDLGSIDSDLSVVASDAQNLLTNGSFQQGLWEKTVRDCDNYDGDAHIGMNLDDQGTDDQKALDLWALRHTACTQSAPIPVTPGGSYLLQFNYKAFYSDQIAYRIVIDGQATKPITKPVASNTGEWQTLGDMVSIPAGVTSVRVELRGLPPGAFSATARFTTFDNVRFTTANSQNIATPQMTQPNYVSAGSVAPGASDKLTVDTSQTTDNLIKNGSLESGLWQQKVGDCNNYDEQPSISMDLTSHASDGHKALELKAKRHIACTGPDAVAVKEGQTYLLSFDYASPNSDKARYYITFNDPNKSSASEELDATSSWQTLTTTVKAPLGATSMAVRVHAISDESGKAEAVNWYDNFSLSQVPDLQNQLIAVGQTTAHTAPKSVTFTALSTTKKQITVRGAKDPFYITMNEAYHPEWELVGISDGQHFATDGFLNGWYVQPQTFCSSHQSSCTRNADGTYDMHLTAQLTPEKWFVIGTIISAIVGIGSLGLLVYLNRAEKRRALHAAIKPSHQRR